MEFWGKVGKSRITSDTTGGEERIGGGRDVEVGKVKGMEVTIENDDLIGEEDEDAIRDMRELAKSINIGEVERVLKVRCYVFSVLYL